MTTIDRSVTSAPARKRAAGRRKQRRRVRGYVYVLPAFLIYLLFAILPALHTVYLSFYNWDGVGLATSAGFSNYVQVLTDPALRGALWHAMVFIIFFAVIPIIIGLVLVGLLARHKRRGMGAFRVLFFLPQVVPMVAVGITWRWMYASDGVVNQVLGLLGLDGITQAWLGSFTFALPAVGLVGTWALTGLCMMLFLSGAAKVDPTLYEAAKLDGAGPVREFLTVTLPALRGEIAVALTVTVIAALASFDVVYVTTNGAPGNTTTVPGLLVYRLAFTNGQVGLASALAVALTILILIVILLINRLVRPQT
ncbi:MAG: carbohydrate ABC transporter permease [Streptosporangiales bacterium]